MSLQGEKKRKVRKQIKGLLNKSVPKSSRICKLVANYKTTLVSKRNGLVFVSHGLIFTLRTPRLVNRKLCHNNVKENPRFVVVFNFDLREFWYFSELIEWSHVFVSLVPVNCECTQMPICYVTKVWTTVTIIKRVPDSQHRCGVSVLLLLLLLLFLYSDLSNFAKNTWLFTRYQYKN